MIEYDGESSRLRRDFHRRAEQLRVAAHSVRAQFGDKPPPRPRFKSKYRACHLLDVELLRAQREAVLGTPRQAYMVLDATYTKWLPDTSCRAARIECWSAKVRGLLDLHSY